LGARVTRASGKSDPGGKVIRCVSDPRPKRSPPTIVNSKWEQFGGMQGPLPVARKSRNHSGGAGMPGHWPSAFGVAPFKQHLLTRKAV